MRSSSVVETNRPTPFVGLHLNYFCISPQPPMHLLLELFLYFSTTADAFQPVFRLQFLLFNVPATISFRGKATTYSGIVGVSFHLNSTKQYFPGSNLLQSRQLILIGLRQTMFVFWGDAPFYKHSSLSPMFPMRRHAGIHHSDAWFVCPVICEVEEPAIRGRGGPLWSSRCNLRLIDGNCHHFVQGWATLDWGTCTSRGKVTMHNACLCLPFEVCTL